MNGWHSITCGLLVGIAAGLAVARSDAQPFVPDTSASQPTIGLVLSGGSAKGLAHIGVLKVFEEEGIPIDVISGTSMGAIVGGLYSIGYSAHQLEQFTTTVDWDRLFSDRSLRRNQLLEVRNANKGIIVSLPFNRAEIRLPSGILFGQNASMLLTRLTWPYQSVTDFTTLPIPFACVATNLRTGDAVALSGVPLPEAIRTSLSLPSIFAPVEIDGQRYIDGGLARNLPAIDAKNLGATFLIGVDVGAAVDSVSARSPSFIDVMLESALFHSTRADAEQRKLIDVLILPDIQGLSRASFEQAEEWIQRGEDAARTVMPQLRAALDSLGVRRAAPRSFAFPDKLEPYHVDAIRITGVEGQKLALVQERAQLNAPATLGPTEIEHAIQRIYGTALFDRVTYTIESSGSTGERDSTILHIRTMPVGNPNTIGFGFRYDSYYKAELLFNLALKNNRRFGTASEFRIRLGEQLEADATYFTRLGRRSRFSVGGNVGLSSAPANLYLPGRFGQTIGAEQDIPVYSLRIENFRGKLYSGFASSESILAGFYGKAEHIRTRQVVAGTVAIDPDSTSEMTRVPQIADSDQDLVAGGFLWQTDTVDRLDFPRQGVRVRAEFEIGISNAIPQISLGPVAPSDLLDVGFYRSGIVDAEWFAPVSDFVSLFGRGVGVYGSGSALPASHYAFVGGINTVTTRTANFIPAWGLHAQQRFGRKAWLAMIGVQVELSGNFVARVGGNVGDTFDLFGDNDRAALGSALYSQIREAPFFGFAMELGLRTRLGPLQLVISGGPEASRPNTSLRFGYEF